MKGAFHMSKSLGYVFAALILLGSLLLPTASWAHGHTVVGDYELVIGFHNEPAYQGEPNGLDLFVTDERTKTRVNGLTDKLKAELIYGASKRELSVKAQWGQQGAYTAYVLPTVAGDYTWHIWGDIEGTAVDVSMTSSPDTFSAVASRAAVSFPMVESTPSELKSHSTTSLILAIVGVALGLLGSIFGIAGLSRRSRRA
jgi:hypothetical protein